MDNNTSQGKNQSFVQQNRNSLVIAGIVIILLVIYFVTRGNTETGQQNQDSGQQTQTSSQPSPTPSGTPSPTGQPSPTGGSQTTPPSSGQALPENLTVTGKLRTSDMPAKGNYLVEGQQGKMYIYTSRDFSSLLDKDVTLSANGNLTAFTLLDIKPAGSVESATDTSAKGGDATTPPPAAPEATKPEEPAGVLTFSGTMGKSDNDSKGNYVITSGKTKVYLQSKQDYAALVGSEVNLTASGSLKGFTSARVSKK